MGQCFIRTSSDTSGLVIPWKTAVPYIKTSVNGWSRARTLYRKTNSTTWTSFYSADLTPPAVPTLTTSISGTRLKIDVKAPSSSDVYRVRVKVGKAVSANNDTDANYISTPDGADATWSDWLIAPNQTRTKYYPVSGSLAAGTTYWVTVWAEDSSHNYSTPVSDSIKYISSGVAAPEPRTATIDATDSKTFYVSSSEWYDGVANQADYLRIGGPSNRTGFIFYSTRISSMLKGAASIQSMKVQIQRYPDWDSVQQARFWLFAHKLPNLISGNPMSSILSTDTHQWYASRGQTLQCTIPSSWYSGIIAGTIVGLGIRSQTSSGTTNDVYWGTFYGQNGGNGRITVTYTK